MRTDKDLDPQDVKEAADADETTQETDLEWLLEQESEEPEEKLFTVKGEEYREQGLSAYEAEMAARPMFRGSDSGDDLANYVDEEIVISSDNAQGDIYGASADADSQESKRTEELAMAVDHSRRSVADDVNTDASVDEGSDILGLAYDDDMGEKFFSIKRVKNAVAGAFGRSKAATAGGGEEVIESDLYVDEPKAEDLAEAPTTAQVAEPGSAMVANEETSSESKAGTELGIEDDAVTQIQSEGTESDNVLDYVAASLDPVDGEDFDEYLLQGEHVIDPDADPEDLTVGEMEGGLSVDLSDGLSDDNTVDYQDDFDSLDGLGLEDATAVATLIPEVLEELSQSVAARLMTLEMDSENLTVDAMLGSDEESIKLCYSQGYQPILAICTESPKALSALSDSQIETIYVRLASSDGSQDFNNLFADDFSFDAVGTQLDTQLDTQLEDEFDSAFDDSAFDSESLLGDLSDPHFETDGALDESLDGDFEEAMSLGDDFAAGMDDLSFGEESGAVFDEAIFDADEEIEALDDESGSLDVTDIDIDLEGALDDELVAEAQVEVGQIEDILGDDLETLELKSVEEAQGFGEDIFGDSFTDDFSDNFDESTDAPLADIDAAFSTLASQTQPEMDLADVLGDDYEAFQDEETVQDTAELEVAAASKSVPIDSEIDASWCIPDNIKFSNASEKDAEIFSEFLDAFIEEGSAEVEKLEDLVGNWEKGATSEDAFAAVIRSLHTIKGIAKGVGLQRYGTLIHNYETLLDSMPRPTEEQEQRYFRIVNVWLDAVVRGIEFVCEERKDVASEFPVIRGTRTTDGSSSADTDSVDSAGSAPKVVPTVVTSAAVSDREKRRDKQLADEGAKALAAQQSVRITSEKLDHLLNLTSQSQQLCVRASQTTTRNKRSTTELQGRLTSVRSHIGKIADRALLTVNARANSSKPDLDALEMDQYSELQEAASILREGVEDLADLVEVLTRQNNMAEALLKQQSSVISSISSSIQGARVVPVSRLMPGLRRIVRTASTDLGKEVSFKVLNETGALDRDYYSRCQVVLEHMVRNALDHGIESPEERLAAGKPNAGRITIDVRKSGGDYIIKLSDDGKGIDPDAIRESAYEKGLDVDFDTMSDDEALRLIFHKGFSTATEVSEISGRGVGMDIVLNELQQIGGDIQIQSVVGLGTSFEVRIPSNVTVNGALFVTAAENSYAIPLNGLIAVDQVLADDYFSAIQTGKPLSLYDLDCEPAYLATLCQGVGLPERSIWGTHVPIIVAGSDDRYMAIAIDNVEEALELVVRSLGPQFTAVPGVAGAATTADGEAIVALDLNLLVASASDEGVAEVAETESSAGNSLLALVVDDSRTQRMVATSQLEAVGVETVTAENGLVAIDLLNATHRLPDVVLLDVEMPVKDGIETLREIRKSQRYGDLPVIMVTSRTGAKHRALAKEAGCNAYMGKPFNFPAMVEQISVLTGHDLQLA